MLRLSGLRPYRMRLSRSETGVRDLGGGGGVNEIIYFSFSLKKSILILIIC